MCVKHWGSTERMLNEVIVYHIETLVASKVPDVCVEAAWSILKIYTQRNRGVRFTGNKIIAEVWSKANIERYYTSEGTHKGTLISGMCKFWEYDL